MVNRRYCLEQYQQYLPISINVCFSLVNNRPYVSLINIKHDISKTPPQAGAYMSYVPSLLEI